MALPAQHVAARAQPFAFRCSACSHCCHHKVIQTNPFELAQLAAFLELDAADLRARWTTDGQGTELARTAQDACVFLGPAGCTVHPARPLVCRLYPLGRVRAGDGTEQWHQLDPHPLSGGSFGGKGTIADYLDAQQAQSYIDAADGYAEWVNQAREVLARLPESSAAHGAALDLLDLDRAVAEHCARHGLDEPQAPLLRLDMHLRLLYDWLAELDGKG